RIALWLGGTLLLPAASLAADKTGLVGSLPWSFRPLTQPAPPTVRNAGWARSDLDRFVLARQEAAKLSPNADADAATLLRRLSFDLTGLPPTPEEVARWERLGPSP